MKFSVIVAKLCVAITCIASTGCSSLGLSLFPTGHFFTDRAEAVVASSPASSPLPRERNKSVVATHYLQPGDVLLIEPVKSGDDIRIPADQTVLVDGSVDMGIFGRVVLAGLSIEGAELLIEQTVFERLPEKSELDRDDVDINVRLIEPVHRYYVLGEVNSPGAYSLRGFETILDGILEAGGLTSKASMCDIILSRPTDPCSCRITLPICYREITQMGDTTTNYQLRPGDRIYVATRGCCDELMFWKANQSCEKCDRCQTACRNPSLVHEANPMASVVATAIPEPSMKMVTDTPVTNNQAHGISGPVQYDAFESPMSATTIAPQSDAAGSSATSSIEPNSAKTFPELMEAPEGFNTDRPTVEPENLNVPRGGEMDGELDLDISPRQSRRFEPMWLK